MIVAKPLWKWAGGKSKLLPEILKYVPRLFGNYHEPFLGGGAVFIGLHERKLLSGKRPLLNDANAELMSAYAVVKTREGSTAFVKRLLAIKHSKEEYYCIRADEPDSAVARAVRFKYLAATCFNGLYRVNASGKFNVPIGSYKNPTLVEPEVVVTWHRALEFATLFSEDFGPRLEAVEKGDFVYVDPPYLPRSKSADFTSYTAGKFGLKDHERLAEALTKVAKRGGHFICSQGDSEVIRSLYKQFRIEAVSVQHSVGARATSRGKVGEVLIIN